MIAPSESPAMAADSIVTACDRSCGPAVWEQKNRGTSGSLHSRECDCGEYTRIVRIGHQRHTFLLSVLFPLRSSLNSYFHSSKTDGEFAA